MFERWIQMDPSGIHKILQTKFVSGKSRTEMDFQHITNLKHKRCFSEDLRPPKRNLFMSSTLFNLECIS